MDAISALIKGAAIGLAVAVPVGPMAILCVNRTLNGGVPAGISTGAGASTVQAAYACAVLLGLEEAGPFLVTFRPVMTTVSAGLLFLFAMAILRRRPEAACRARGGSVLRNYGSAAAFNCLNPMLAVLLVAATGAVIGPAPMPGWAIPVVLAGLFAGSIGWWVVLSAMTAGLRRRINSRFMLGINRVAAASMAGFAVLSLARLAIP